MSSPVDGDGLISSAGPMAADRGRRERTLEFLVEAGRRLAASLDLKTLYGSLLEIVEMAMPCDGFVISSYNEQSKEIRCEFVWDGGKALDAASLPPIELSEDGGMQSTVIRTGKPLIFANVQEQVKEPNTEFYDVKAEVAGQSVKEIGETATHSAAMVPIKLDNLVVGVVQVMCDEPGAYDKADLQILEGLVHQLAIAAQNARLYERARQEIADRKRAEEALRASEARLWQALDAMPNVAWSVDAAGKVDYINRRLFEYGGGDDQQRLTGANGWANLVHPEDAAAHQSAYRECVANGIPWSSEMRLRRHDGVYRWHLARMEPIRDADGAIIRWFGTSTDVQDMKEAQEMLIRLNDELEHRVAERTQELQALVREMEGFTYSVSHDLRAPLRTISATSHILLHDAHDLLHEEMREQLRRQAKAANKLGALIDDLLKLSRLARSEIVKVAIDLSELSSVVVEELTSRQPSNALRVEVQDGMSAYGDEQLVKLVLVNLVENAIKFSPDGDSLHIGESEPGSFFVRDHGVGFDMRYQEKMWQPFERLVRDDEFPGTGIGLANVKRIVERHGGRVWAEGEPGVGATFHFTLPLKENAAS